MNTCVSMKSGLRDRNNTPAEAQAIVDRVVVSMKSGLRDRNNIVVFNDMPKAEFVVSMKSGLRDRNNCYNLTFIVPRIYASQ